MSQQSAIAQTTSTSTEPSPVLFFETANAYQRTAALRAAVDLELFTAIGEGARSPETLAPRCRASERGIRILCDYLTIIGFLTKEDGRYSLTPDSAFFLDKRSPAYVGGALKFLSSRDLTSGFDDLTETVRQGKTQMGGAGTVDPEDPIWVEFAGSMSPLAAPSAEFVGELVTRGHSGPIRVLDIAAGHGLYGIAVARRNPQARIVALDWPNVLNVAEANAKAAGVGDRYELLPGDAFKVEFGERFDVVLVTNLLHHFNVPTCELLIRKVRNCLKPSGRAITVEFVPNNDRISPPIPASFALMMLGTTPAGDAYTFEQYDGIFRRAGFQRSEILQITRSPQQAIISYA